jgi:hypothetical protein
MAGLGGRLNASLAENRARHGAGFFRAAARCVTLISDDCRVMESAKELAAERGTTAGRILSELARTALMPRGRSMRKRNGVPILPKSRLVTPEIVNRLRDEP